jgi:hypothetical protein
MGRPYVGPVLRRSPLSEPMEEKPRRRCLRLGAGAMVVIAALCGVYLILQWQIVRERRQVRFLVPDRGGACDAMIDASNPFSAKYDPQYAIPWAQAALGANFVSWIGLPPSMTEAERSRVRLAFPEAVIEMLSKPRPTRMR